MLIQRSPRFSAALCAALAAFYTLGCSTSQQPPITIEPTRTELLTEVAPGSFAIREGGFVAPAGFQVLPDSGFPPKLVPTSGTLLVAFVEVSAIR